MGKKASNIEKQQRLDIVYEQIVKGWSRAEICRYVSDKWNLDERTADRYISEVKEELKKRSEKKKDHQFQLAVDRLEMLYKKNMNIQDYRECRQTQQEISKLYGLYPSEKIDHNVKVEQPLFLDVSKNNGDK